MRSELGTPAPVPEGPDRRPRPAPVEGVPPNARRLQRMGTVTVGVSLPREWIDGHRLAVGHPVYLRTLASGALLVQDRLAADAIGRAVLEIRRGEPREHLFRRLIGAYVGGATEFVLHEPSGVTPETRTIARAFVRRTVQPEIVSEESTALVLRDVSRGAGLSLDRLLRRMFQVVLELQQEAGRSWDDAPRTREEVFETRDDEVDRHAWLVERILALQQARELRPPLGEPPADALQYLLLARALERIGDHAVSLHENGSRLRSAPGLTPVRHALTSYHRQVLENLRQAFAVAEAADPVHGNEVIDSAEALHATHAALTDKFLARGGVPQLSPLAIGSVALVLQSIDRTTAYAQDIAQVGVDRGASHRIHSVDDAAGRPVPELSQSFTKKPKGGIKEP